MTRTTLPAVTATATRPSLPAGSEPNFCCSSTTAPVPSGLTATVVSASTALASRPNSAVLWVRYSFAAATGSLARPVASVAGPSVAGVPNAFQRILVPSLAAADACAAVGFIEPVRLSTSAGPARFVAAAGSAAAVAPAGAALATPFMLAATSATTATPVTADAARRRAAHPPVLRTAPPLARVTGTANQTNRAGGVGPTRVSRNVAYATVVLTDPRTAGNRPHPPGRTAVSPCNHSALRE